VSFATTLNSFDVTAREAIMSSSDGVPGAIEALIAVFQHAEQIDPDDALGPWGVLSALNQLDCYGAAIDVLHTAVCSENIVNFIGVLRAVQLGLLADSELRRAIENAGGLDVDDVLRRVRERLPHFQK
jgi:hypothetical protein